MHKCLNIFLFRGFKFHQHIVYLREHLCTVYAPCAQVFTLYLQLCIIYNPLANEQWSSILYIMHEKTCRWVDNDKIDIVFFFKYTDCKFVSKSDHAGGICELMLAYS